MSKGTEKKKLNNFDTRIVEILSKKYDVTPRFVLMSIKEERTSERAQEISKDYKRMTREIKRSYDSLKNPNDIGLRPTQ